VTTSPLPFSAERHVLGDLELGPLGDDLAAIAARLVTIGPWGAAGVAAETMRERLARPMAATFRFALRQDGRPVGCLVVRHPFMRGPYVELVAVFPEAQRRGLLARVIDWMAAEVADTEANLWLCVTESNAPARAAYAALGFAPVGPLPDLVRVGQTEILMRRVIGPPM
jgi:GNAT superfamily N-acetyltransferase